MEKSRSLTDRRSSSARTSPQEPEHPPVPTIPDVDTNGVQENEAPEETTAQPKSPLLTARALSTTSLDNVELGEEHNEENTAPKDISKPALPQRSAKPSLQGLSGMLPLGNFGPPPQAPVSTNIPSAVSNPPPAPKRSPFSFFSRHTSSQVSSPPPVPPERRNTASSIATIGSNPEMMLSKLEEGHESDGIMGSKPPARNSLRDRFKLLRMREEAGITSLGDDDKGGSALAGLIGRSASLGMGLASPTSMNEDRDASLAAPSPSSPVPLSPNPSLAPGTVAGVSAGPSSMNDPSTPVDWDLWQAVVYEGPAAVARTSPEELNSAIATGIPNAIRGVVWQVLAQSKNEELESVYRDLVSRGTDKDKDRMSGSSNSPSVSHSNGSMKEREEVVSSASSVHSDHSTPSTTFTNGLRSPSPPKERDLEAAAKAQAASLAEKKKKAKEDAASLQKLEKAIKRDLGARTSFSKFAASAGLQEGLFGVCKAYALFDEGVGYAQGMNFLVMPLLFNVSGLCNMLPTLLRIS